MGYENRPKKLLTRQELAAHFQVQPGTITRWERDGMPVEKKRSRGKATLFDLAAVEKWKADTDVARLAEGLSLEQERALATREQRIKTEMENRVRRGELVEREDVVAAGLAYTKAWVAKVRGLPRALFLAGLINREQEAAVAVLCRELLTEIAMWKTVADAERTAERVAS